ncbi:MAG: class I SAM-dependent methyltransferase [Patescibacteria group bacterium]|mgnify:CR=1 FL=1
MKLKAFVKKALNWGSPDKYVRKLHEKKAYLDAYAAHTDTRVAEGDYQRAIGGSWDEMGKLQFDFLVKKGLKPEHSMLDIGCGTLRGGRHFIKYLNSGNYTGFDISEKAIERGRRVLQEEGLANKNPRLFVTKEKNLKFHELGGKKFDFILAQSVLTHLPPEPIEECFEYIGKVMNEGGVFYFTYFQAERYRHFSIEDFEYPFSHFESLGKQFGFVINNCSSEYPHPIGQKMAEVKKRDAKL